MTSRASPLFLEKTHGGLYPFMKFLLVAEISAKMYCLCREIFLCLNSTAQLKVELVGQVNSVQVGSIRRHENQVQCTEKWVQFFRSSESEQKMNKLRFGST
jgi:hypothetical protein